EPLEAALVDDSRVYHGVTPVLPLDPARPAFRDVLVVTFRHE
ncbi:MAG TPA: 2OG-Fe dioxygenase family protein, partial [Acetobacteraceae bacterium]|nr:2OG-Fe dioxygenase family protein [Acetobacteraceae bacterium]